MWALCWLHAAIVHGQGAAEYKWMVPRTFVSTILHVCRVFIHVVTVCLRVCPSLKVMRPGLTADLCHIHPVILVSDFHHSVILNLFHQSA